MSEETTKQTPIEGREELSQGNITHDGKALPAEVNNSDADSYMGATEDSVSRNTPPMEGPANIVSGADNEEDGVDAESELTPG